MQQLIPALALAGLALSPSALPQDAVPAKSSLKVLLVSHDPETPQVPFKDMAHERHAELYGERAALWEALLAEHFEHVSLVYGEQYEASMSDAVDVTIFDAKPPVAKEAVRDGMNYEPAEYLPRTFDRPALMISENSPRLGEPLGLKLDWL